MSETEIRKIVRSILETELEALEKELKKKYITKEEAEEMVKNSFVNLFKYLWEKKGTYINKIA
jgi:hypothetical protein